MSFFRVRYLSFFFILISIFSFLNIIYSYYFNLYLNLNTYYFSLIISAVIGIIFYKIKTSPKKPSIFEKDDTVVFLAKKDSISVVENIFRISSI